MSKGWGMGVRGQLPSFEGKSTWILATDEDKQQEEVDWTLANKDDKDSTKDETDLTLASEDSSEKEEEVDWTIA